jgi:hypothetical protein
MVACPGVQLHDVEDAEAFVAVTVRTLGLALSHHDREDLGMAGLEVMLELAVRYRPAHHAKRGGWSFSSYAGELLPRRLLTHWHKQQGHRRTRDAAGKRGWDYRATASLDGLMAAPEFNESAVVTITRFQRPPREPVAA